MTAFTYVTVSRSLQQFAACCCCFHNAQIVQQPAPTIGRCRGGHGCVVQKYTRLTNCRFDDPEDPDLKNLYPREYDPQTHRFANILPRDHTYHVERDTVRMHAADGVVKSDVTMSRSALQLQLPGGMTSKPIGHQACCCTFLVLC